MANVTTEEGLSAWDLYFRKGPRTKAPEIDLRLDFVDLTKRAETLLAEKGSRALLLEFSKGIPVSNPKSLLPGYPELWKGSDHKNWLTEIGIDPPRYRNLANQLIRKAFKEDRYKPKPEYCTDKSRTRHNACPPEFFAEALKKLLKTGLLTVQAVLCSLSAIFCNIHPPASSYANGGTHFCKLSTDERARHIIQLATTCVSTLKRPSSSDTAVSIGPKSMAMARKAKTEQKGDANTNTNLITPRQQELRNGLKTFKRKHEDAVVDIATELQAVNAEVERLTALLEKQKRLKDRHDSEQKEIEWAQDMDVCLADSAISVDENADAVLEIALKFMGEQYKQHQEGEK